MKPRTVVKRKNVLSCAAGSGRTRLAVAYPVMAPTMTAIIVATMSMLRVDHDGFVSVVMEELTAMGVIETHPEHVGALYLLMLSQGLSAHSRSLGIVE